MKERLTIRLQHMDTAIQQSLANHNALLGRKQELQEVMDNWEHLNSPESVQPPQLESEDLSERVQNPENQETEEHN